MHPLLQSKDSEAAALPFRLRRSKGFHVLPAISKGSTADEIVLAASSCQQRAAVAQALRKLVVESIDKCRMLCAFEMRRSVGA